MCENLLGQQFDLAASPQADAAEPHPAAGLADVKGVPAQPGSAARFVLPVLYGIVMVNGADITDPSVMLGSHPSGSFYGWPVFPPFASIALSRCWRASA